MRTKGAIVILGLLCMPLNAHAEPYAGAAVGYAAVQFKESGFDFDAADTSTHWFVGYATPLAWLPEQWQLGVEGGYINFGRPDDTIGDQQVEIAIDGFPVVVTGSLPLGPRLELLARAGVIFWQLDIKTEGFNFVGDDSGTDLTAGMGLAFQPPESPFRVRLAADAFAIGGEGTWSLSLGVDYRFGREGAGDEP